MSSAGDKGETFIPRLGRVRKSHPRIEAFGEVDELSSFIGLARSAVKDPHLASILKTVQESLFHVGSYLALPSHPLDKLRENNEKIKTWIAEIGSELPPLQRFIFPSGAFEASLLHVCRAVARRAERSVARLADFEEVDETVTTFLNKLSLLLFLLARLVNKKTGFVEEEWKTL
ncbi:MAG: cob(I)yrinic acid a,c-diamide adenosyltransferase [Candidatus Caldarchaeum sp.]